ncbi:MAG: hypothetical protein ACOZE5_18405 [Verrucomicrobiota bacterium]
MIMDLMTGLVATAAIAAPGWLLAWRHRLPLPALAGFAGGAVAWMLLVVLLDALSLGLGRGALATGWLAIVALCLLVARRQTAPASSPVAESVDWRAWLPLLPVLLIVAYRAAAQPLHGADTAFRWEFLARQMWTHSTLAFYPPVTAADYALYSWPDGIAPLVASLYQGIYAAAGAARPVATAPVVLFQVVLLFAATRALARQEFSARAALFAGLLLATMPLAPWAAGMGQETGLTALSVLGLLLYLPRDRQNETRASVVAAAACAALGALAREYGLIFPALGFLLVIVRGLSPTTRLIFLATASLLVLPWYARNWLLTGHPLFNHALAGLFPLNEAHARLMAIYQENFSWRHLPPEAPRVFFTYGFTALFAGLTGAIVFFRRLRPTLVFCAVMLSLYVVSLGHTAGGYFYGLRLLSPGFALCAVAGGAALARWVPGRTHLVGVMVGLCLLAADSALKNLTLPANPYRVPPTAWLRVGNAIHEFHDGVALQRAAQAIGDSRAIVLGPQAQLQRLGVACAPPWSPELTDLFNPQITPADLARRLADLGFCFVLTYRQNINFRYLSASPLCRQPLDHLRVVLASDDLILYQIVSDATGSQATRKLPRPLRDPEIQPACLRMRL